MSSLPKYFEKLKYSLLYGKENIITLSKVQCAIRTKKLAKLKDFQVKDNGEDLKMSRGVSERRGNQYGNESWSNSKSKEFDKLKYKYFIFHKTCHFKKDCPEHESNSDFIHIMITFDRWF